MTASLEKPLVMPFPVIEDLAVRALAAGLPGIAAYSTGDRVIAPGHSMPRYSVVSFGCGEQVRPAALEELQGLGAPEWCGGDPFCGWAGFISYDAKHLAEEAAAPPGALAFPLMGFLRVDSCYVLDRQTRRATVHFSPAACGERRAWFTETVLRLASEASPAAPLPPLMPGTTGVMAMNLDQSADFTLSQYASRVSAIKEEIFAGCYYEINFTQRFRRVSGARPHDVGRRLLQSARAPYGAFLDFGEFQVLSASPELFLRRRGDMLQTRPIKGSAPRSKDRRIDRRSREKLEVSAKDLAEHTMVVDLSRNDLGRVCSHGSIRVRDIYGTESFATIHHMVSTVQGTLAPGSGIAGLFRATFPPASVTGAPKVRVMQAIGEHERSPREIYTGAVGHFGGTRDFCFNVAIRTIVSRPAPQGGTEYTLGAGGAIVADSDPEGEYRECLLKAAPLVQAILDTERDG